MHAIETRYLGPTNYRGSRVVAEAGDKDRRARVVLSYDSQYSDMRAFLPAVLALCKKMNWIGAHYGNALLGAGTKRGYVFVHVHNAENRFDVFPFSPEDIAEADARRASEVAERRARWEAERLERDAYVNGDPDYSSTGARAVRGAVYDAMANGAQPIRGIDQDNN